MRKILFIEILLFILIVTGFIPRTFALVLGGGLVLASCILSLENAILLFISSIPFFLALPLTETFDNFNTWRIISLIIFVRWLWLPETRHLLRENIQQCIHQHRQWYREHPTVTILLALLLLAFASVIGSLDAMLAIKRIIYFINLSLVGIVIYNLLNKNTQFFERILHAIAIPTIAVIVVGYIQVISTYLIDVYQFMRLWGEGIQARQFGNEWSQIAVELGNTWLAYYGDQLSLRVFSLFPDSHSFPQFVLLGLPAIFALSLNKIIATGESLKHMIRTRARLLVIWIPLGFLIIILSGTRGIWAASIGVVLLACGLLWWMKRKTDARHSLFFTYISTYLVVFFFLFTIAYPVFVSPQFLLSKGNFLLLSERIKSIIDFGETSNAQRILIWKQSLASIQQHPLLGVGIGNFPVVLGQDLFLARAGSSAHNIYLHIAAEMGIAALLATLLLLWKLFTKTYKAFVATTNPKLLGYFGAALLVIPWVCAYSLTDVALFDERSFLLFVVTIGIIAAHHD